MGCVLRIAVVSIPRVKDYSEQHTGFSMIKSSHPYTARKPSSWRCRLCQPPTSYFNLLVLVLVSWNVQANPSAIDVHETHNHTLNCNLTGNITWLKDGTNISKNRKQHLVLKDINRNDSGTYNCSNSTASEEFIVTVKYKAAALKVFPASTVRLKSGENVRVYCQVQGVPWPRRIIWRKDGKVFQDVCQNLTLNKVNCSQDVSQNLTLNKVNCSQAGIYTCEPHNSLGNERTQNVSIQVTPPPPENVTLKLSTNDAAGLVASWSSTQSDDCRAVMFRVNLTQCSSNKSFHSYRTHDGNYHFTNLTPSTAYCVKVRTESTEGKSDWIAGSNPQIIVPLTAPPTVETTTTGPKVLVISVAVTVSLAFVVFILIMAWWFRKQASTRLPCQGFFQIENPPSPEEAPSDKTGPIAISRFKMHCARLHADSDYRFSVEFKSCPAAKKATWNNSDKPENQTKNRFANVVAYDHSRVVLSLNDGDPESHYINANFVDGYNKPNAYIATQGPLPNNVNDFWKMVWEQNCHVIVMITNIIEKGRRKCTMYWPAKKEETKEYGALKITSLDEDVFAHYTVRTFEVKPSDCSTHYTQDPTDDVIRPMFVTQYHFTGWPDHGAPENGMEYPAMDFILKSGAANLQAHGPIIVHCSAGVGRSGAYIVIQSMVDRIRKTGDVDIYRFLAQIRKQRNHLVQEPSQYIFVHDALLQYIENALRLSIPMNMLRDHVQKLRTEKGLTNKSKMTEEYQKIAVIAIKAYDLKEAMKLCNQSKNRHAHFIPADSKRVKLYPRPGEVGSDYINASYLDGFWRREGYIATQHPLEATVNDFWRMVWQENSRSIVMLTSQEELDKDDYDQYVPVINGSTTFDNYKVTTESETIRGDTSFKQLTMHSLSDPSNSRKIQHFHLFHWREDSAPWSGQTVLQLISKVDEWESDVRANADRFEEIGPIVVHCNYGVGRTGVYCVLHTLYHQLHQEECVSLQQIARMYNFQRPCCIRSQVQYEFCYDTLMEYIEADCSLHLV